MDTLQLTPEVQVSHVGPPLEEGRLPSVFYFALSDRESLELDPYNQPAIYLAHHDIRVFSLSLPAHGPNLNALDAITAWAKEFEQGRDPLSPFVDHAIFAIEELISRGYVVREKIGLMGLSRGGLIASLIGAKAEFLRAIVNFAPLTKLTMAKEFAHLQENELVTALNLENHVEALCDRQIRFYIGNHDTRVGTDRCFQLVQNLANAAYDRNLRSPPVELIVTRSIGQMGHGTSKEAFEAGADWLGRELGGIR